MTESSGIDLIAFGEILWDIIDDVPHLGGAPFNLAAHASLCGLSSAIISALGSDDLGEAALARATELNIGTRWIIRDRRNPTGTVRVKLDASIPQYTIHEGAAWDNIDLTQSQVESIAACRPRVLCFGTLAQRSPISADSLKRVLAALPDTLVFFDVNLRQHYWQRAHIINSLGACDWLKVNTEESLLLDKLLFNSDLGAADFAGNAMQKFDLTGVIVTCGAEGCLVFGREHELIAAPSPEIQAIDTVGAGDAFSAAFLAALLRGADLNEAAWHANRRGALVASKRGAIPADSAYFVNGRKF